MLESSTATPVTKADLLAFLQERQMRSYQAVMRLIKQKGEQVRKLQNSVIFRQPERLYDAYVQKLDHLKTRLLTKVRQTYDTYDRKENLLRQRLLSLDLSQRIQRYQEQLKQDQRLLLSHMSSQYDSKLARFEKAQDALLSLDTTRIVARGYAIVQKDNHIIQSTQQIKKGDHLKLEMKDGYVQVEVEDVK